MATLLGPDLSPARVAIERLMDDTCVITREVIRGTSDDVLNTTTGAIVAPDPAERVVYYEWSRGHADRLLRGRCKIKPVSDGQSSGQSLEQGGVRFAARTYVLGLPWDALEPAVGDQVSITSSRRDPALVGLLFVVRDVLRSTMLVQRRVTLERRDNG